MPTRTNLVRDGIYSTGRAPRDGRIDPDRVAAEAILGVAETGEPWARIVGSANALLATTTRPHTGHKIRRR
jgi:hypothetical protein